MTRIEVDALFDRIMLYYPNFEAFPERVDEWHKVLADQDATEVDSNLTEYTKQSKWPPTPADLITAQKPPSTDPVILSGGTALKEINEWKQQAVPPPPEVLEKLAQMRREVDGRN